MSSVYFEGHRAKPLAGLTRRAPKGLLTRCVSSVPTRCVSSVYFMPTRYVCVFITAVPNIKLFAWGTGWDP